MKKPTDTDTDTESATPAQIARAGALLLELNDAIEAEPDVAVMMTALTGVVLVALDRYGATPLDFYRGLMDLKPLRDAKLAADRESAEQS